MALRVRELTPEEERILRQQAHSRTEAARLVERARIVWLVHCGEGVPPVADRLALTEATVRKWSKRFNALGIAGLTDQPRSGRPPTYTVATIGEVIATALTPPRTLELPFACWTLDRLTASLHERPVDAGGPLPVSRSHIDRILSDEGRRWRKPEPWFGERVGPELAETRGPSKHSGRHHLREVS